MVLIVEIAAGVLIGLLAYRSLLWYASTGITFTTVKKLFLRLGSLAAILVGFGCVLLHPSSILPTVGAAVTSWIIYAVWSDTAAKRKARALALRGACLKCGTVGLQFLHFEEGYKAESGREYDHPIGRCTRCNAEQKLSGA